MRLMHHFGLAIHALRMADYDPMALLAAPLDDFHAPTQMPLGSYVAQATDYEFDKTKPKDKTKEPTSLVRVKIALVEPFPDVDKDAIKAVLDETGKTLMEIEQRPIDFFLTPEAMYRFTEFTREHAKISMEEAPNGQEALEVLKTSGKQFGVEMVQVPNQREPSKPYHQIGRTFPLP